jgi:two-component system chemotaxis response regulator CheY
MKVLLIDDSSTMRKIQKRVLESMSITDIVEAGNGKEALVKLQENNNDFTFILCDINMPEMNGMETLKAIRSNPDTAKLPVIMQARQIILSNRSSQRNCRIKSIQYWASETQKNHFTPCSFRSP